MAPTVAAVAGAGAAGLATSLALEQRGLVTRLFMQPRPTRLDGAAIMMWSNGVNAARRLGLGPELAGDATRITTLDITDWHGRVLWTMPVQRYAEHYGAPFVAYPRQALLQSLEARLRQREAETGRAIIERATVADVRRRANGVTLTLTDGSDVESDVVIGADGHHSRVRNWLHGDGTSRRLHTRAWLGYSEPYADGPPPGTAFIAMGHRRRVWAARLEDHRTAWYAFFMHGTKDDPNPDTYDAVADLLHTGHEGIRKFVEHTPPEAALNTELADRPPLQGPVGRGPVTLVGDAFQTVVPDLAQGTGKAFEAACDLAARVTSDGSLGAEQLRAYEATRQPREARLANTSLSLTFLCMPNTQLGDVLRDAWTRFVLPRQADTLLDWKLSYVAGREGP